MRSYECYRLTVPSDEATGLSGDYDTLVLAESPAKAAEIAANILDVEDGLTAEEMKEAREIVVIDSDTREVSYFWVHSKTSYSASQQELADWMKPKPQKIWEQTLRQASTVNGSTFWVCKDCVPAGMGISWARLGDGLFRVDIDSSSFGPRDVLKITVEKTEGEE